MKLEINKTYALVYIGPAGKQVVWTINSYPNTDAISQLNKFFIRNYLIPYCQSKECEFLPHKELASKIIEYVKDYQIHEVLTSPLDDFEFDLKSIDTYFPSVKSESLYQYVETHNCW